MNFLGRTFDEKTMTWVYPDGSGGVYTEEDRQEVFNACERKTGRNGYGFNGIFVLAKLFELQDTRK